MVDEARLKRYAWPLLLGTLSAVLYSTVALMPFFLVPLMVAGVRKGYKAMIASAASSAIIIGAWQVMLLARAGAVSAGMLTIGLSAPAAMIAALVGMASPRLKKLSFASRGLLGAAAASALSLPAILAALRDPSVRAMFLDAFDKASSALGAGTLDSESLWDALKTGIASSYGAVLFVFLFVSSWIGSRLGSANRLKPTAAKAEPLVPEIDGQGLAPEGGPALPPTLAAYRVPGSFVWVLFAAWGGLLLNRFLPSLVLSAVALNAALALSICYGVQGLAVANALAERVGLAPALRILGPIALILLLASGVAGLAAVAVLALLGTLETWIPFRAVTKGDKP